MGEMVVKHKHRFLFGLLLINLTLYAQNPPPTYLSAVSGDEEVDPEEEEVNEQTNSNK